jgi:hypothetical protein
MDSLESSFGSIEISKPKLIGAFSLDENRKYQHGIKNLKYLQIPRDVHFNLNDGEYILKKEYDAKDR